MVKKKKMKSKLDLSISLSYRVLFVRKNRFSYFLKSRIFLDLNEIRILKRVLTHSVYLLYSLYLYVYTSNLGFKLEKNNCILWFFTLQVEMVFHVKSCLL
jgi:hypothetical protein